MLMFMKNLLNRIKNWRNISFVQDTAIMQASNVFTTLVSIAASILFARLLLPEQYGMYRVVFSFAGIILIFISLGIDSSMSVFLSEAYVKKDKKEIAKIIAYFIKATLVISILIGGLLILSAPFWSKLAYGSEEIGRLSRLIIISNIAGMAVVFSGIILQVRRQVGKYAAIETAKESLKIGFSVVAVFAGFGVAGMLKGQLIAVIFFAVSSVFIYIFYFSKDPLLPGWKDLIKGWREVKIGKYLKFAVLNSLDKNVVHLYSLLPLFFLGIFFPAEQVGYFNIAFKYITIPLLLLSPVSQLLDIRMPQMNANEGLDKLRRNFHKVSFVSGLLTCSIATAAILFGPFLIKLFYGKEYAESVPLIYILMPFTIMSGFSIGLGSLFRTLNKMSASFAINLALFVLGVWPAFYFTKNYGLAGISSVYFMWFFLSNLISYIYIRKYLYSEASVIVN